MTNPANQPSIGAIVINYNSGDDLLRTLGALTRQTMAIKQILVVDNASSDDSLSKAQAAFPQVTWLPQSENIGLSKARNLGLAHLDTNLALLLDDDVYLEPDTLEKMTAAMAETKAAVVAPRIVYADAPNLIQCDGAIPHFSGTLKLRHTNMHPDQLTGRTWEVKGCIGACMLFDRAKISELGNFNEQFFFYFEDLEFSLRVRACGQQIVCVQDAVAHHDRGHGTQGLSFRGQGDYPRRRAYLVIRNRWQTILLHFSLKWLVLLSPILGMYELATLTVTLSRGWLPEWRRAWVEIRQMWPELKRQRQAIAQTRRVDGPDLLGHGRMPFSIGFTQSWLEDYLVVLISYVFNGYWFIVSRLFR